MRYRVIASVVVGALLAGALSLAALGPRAAWFGAARAQASAATWFEVHASEGVTTVYFVGWTVGDVLTLTMDDPQTPKSPDYVTQVKARGAEDAAGKAGRGPRAPRQLRGEAGHGGKGDAKAGVARAQ